MSDLQIQFPKAHLDKMSEHALGFDKSRPGQPHHWRFDGVSNFDASESIFVARQLEYMRPGVYMVEYPELQAKGLMPFNMSVDPGAETYTVQIIDRVGKPRLRTAQSNDTPMVELSVNEGSMKFFSMDLGYAYTLQEARAAIYARKPLIPTKAMACREEMERELDTIAFLGEAVTGIKGLLTQSGTNSYSTPATGVAGAKTFDSKDADLILLDLNSAVAKVVTDSKQIEIPDTMVLPNTTWALLTSRRVGDGTSSTIMKYFRDNNPWIREVAQSYHAEAAPAAEWTGKRGVIYKKDPSRLEVHVPQPFEQLPPIAAGFEVKTLCHMRTGGLAVYRPKSICYFDEI